MIEPNTILIENIDVRIDWKRTFDESGMTVEDIAAEVGSSRGTLLMWCDNRTKKPQRHTRKAVIEWLQDKSFTVYRKPIEKDDSVC